MPMASGDRVLVNGRTWEYGYLYGEAIFLKHVDGGRVRVLMPSPLDEVIVPAEYVSIPLMN